MVGWRTGGGQSIKEDWLSLRTLRLSYTKKKGGGREKKEEEL